MNLGSYILSRKVADKREAELKLTKRSDVAIGTGRK